MHLPDDFTDRQAFATFRAVADQRPDAVAIVDGQAVMTYGELLAAAEGYASPWRIWMAIRTPK